MSGIAREMAGRRSARTLPAEPIILLVLLAAAVPAPAQFNRTALLVNMPTADVLRVGMLRIAPDLSFPLNESPSNPGLDPNLCIRFSPLDNLELAVNAYTPADYVLGVSYQVFSSQPRGERIMELRDTTDRTSYRQTGAGRRAFLVAVGVHDIGIHSYVTELGHDDDAWPDVKYRNRQPEGFSAFAVASIPVFGFARVHVGLGRGRYVGDDTRSHYLNTDVFFDEPQPWAFGIIGGLEVNLNEYLALAADVTGRDANAGMSLRYGALSLGVAVTKIEGLVFATGAERSGRLAVGVGYDIDLLRRRSY